MPTSEAPIISIQNLHKQFMMIGKSIEVVSDVSLDFKKNMLIAIIGASGSGKSTFLNLLGGLDKPDKGKIFVANHDITTMNETNLAKLRNEDIGFIFQQHQLISELTVLENVLLPASIPGKATEEITDYALYLLERIGLKERQDHLIGELSGGEMQRVSIARALINSPQVILADEPTGDLDEKNAFEVFDLLKELAAAKKTTVIMVTHDLRLAQKANLVYEIRAQQLFRVRIKST